MGRIRFGRVFGIFYGMSLIKKFILAYVLIIAVPITVLGINALNNVATASRQDVYKNELFYLQLAKSGIRRNMEVCVRAAQLAINSKDLVEFLSDRRAHTTEELIDFKNGPLRNFEKIININPDIYQMRFFLDHSFMDEIWPSILNDSRLDGSEWKDEVVRLKGKSYWRLNHKEETIRKSDIPEEVVSMYIDVGYAGWMHTGVLEVSMRTSVFYPEMNNLYDGSESILCLVDSRKALYTGRDHGVLASFRDKGQFLDYLLPNTAGEEGDFTFNTVHGDYLAVYSYVEELDAYIYKVISLQALTEKIEKSRNMILLGMIGGFTLLVFVTYLITRVLLKKTRTIISAMRKVQEGELNIEIAVEGNDEIGEVAYHFKKMMGKINELIYMLVRKEAATKEAEIKALQSQINKHFVYNVLEAIKMMAEINSQFEISDTVTVLGRLMRYSMSWNNKYVALREEIEYIRNYISLLNIRYDYEIRLDIDVDARFMDLEILKMSLQPIVENSFTHGLEPRGDGGKITITAYSDEDMLTVEIEDDGVGMDAGQLERLRQRVCGALREEEADQKTGGIGLKNVSERIKLFYGPRYGLEMFSEEGKFTRVRIRLPCLGD